MISVQNLIIGAGLSGLNLANKLLEKNQTVIILEKSRGVGGRIATRRIEEKGLDHGVLFFPDSPEVHRLIETFQFKHRSKNHPEGIYLEGGMTALPKAMAKNIAIKFEERALSIEKSGSAWIVSTDKGTVYEAKNLILTAPLPQALELLDENKISYSKNLKLIQYEMGLLALFTLNSLLSLPDYKEENGHVLYLAKSRNLHPFGLVLRASPEFSAIHFNQDNELNLVRLRSLAEILLGQKLAVETVEIKKWKYLQPKASFPEAFHSPHPNLYLIGDSFLSPGVRGALLSSEALARELT